MSSPAVHRQPLLLLHGVTNSALIWTEVIPLLIDSFDVLAPTAAGHRGGAPAHRPTTIARLVDDVETLLDQRGLGAVHIAGNSLGGFMAIELARRGRARTVCALSPAGFWTPGTPDQLHATDIIRRGRALARWFAWPAHLLVRSPAARRLILRDVAERGQRLSPELTRDILDGLTACPAADDLLQTTESIAPLDPLPCPITLAWAERDRIFPPDINGRTARERMPGARYLQLPATGHVPMIDNPQLCAQVISDATRAGDSATGRSS